MSAATFWLNDCNATSENSSAVGNTRSAACNSPMISNSNCRGTTTINDWLRQHHQQQQQQQQQQQKQSGSQSQSQPIIPPLDVFFIKSDPVDGFQLSTVGTDPHLDVDQLAELTESERDYQMDLNAAIVAASSSATGVGDFKPAPVTSSTNDRRQCGNQPAMERHRGPGSLLGQRWTAYDNVDEEDFSPKNIDNDHSLIDETHDNHIDEILRQCVEYDQRTSACQSKSQSGKQSAHDVTSSHHSVLPMTLSSARNTSDTSMILRLELPLHQTGSRSRSPRTSPCFNTSEVTGSCSPSISSKIKTNGSLTSPIHGRRAVAMGTSPPESSPLSIKSPSVADNTTSTSYECTTTDAGSAALVPCWLETPAAKMHAENMTSKTKRSEFIAADKYRIDSVRRQWPGAEDTDDDDDVPSADWSEDGRDDVEDDVIANYDNRRLFSTDSELKVS